jgi:hypothetical protein
MVTIIKDKLLGEIHTAGPPAQKDDLEQLKKILDSYIVLDYLLVRDYHESGMPHLHVYLKTSEKCNITSSTFLDLKNVEGQ